jgi:5-methylcytosine-specific restriction endonuclease McrA
MYGMQDKLLVKDPHPQSHAALIKLHFKLLRGVAYFGYRGWLRFRLQTLEKWLEERGDLVCIYCGKQHLRIDAPSNSDDLATIDHKLARAKGGAEMDLNNLVCACSPCNLRKKTKSYEEFKNTVKLYLDKSS